VFNVGRVVVQHALKPLAHIIIKRIIAAENDRICRFKLSPIFEQWRAHRNADLFRFLRPRNDTTIIIAQHYHRLSCEFWIECPLRAGVEIIGVNQSNRRRHQLASGGSATTLR